MLVGDIGKMDGITYDFADDIFNAISFIKLTIKISLKFFLIYGQIRNTPAVFQIIAWHSPGGTPWSQPMLT